MKNKIIIISEYFYPDNRTDAKLLSGIAKKLNEIKDGNINVICTSTLENEEELDFIKNKIYRLKKNKINENNIFLRIIKFIILTIKLTFKAILIIKKDDRVLLTTNPAFLMLFIAFFKKFKKFEYTLIVYDVFPENIHAAKLVKNNSLIYIFIKKIYDWAYSSADRLIVIGRDMKEVISLKTKNKVPLYLIENWCDYKDIVPKSKNKNNIISNLSLTNKIVFLFAGNLGLVQGIDTLLKASRLVKNKDFALLFIGEGSLKKDILTFIQEDEDKNVYYGGSFSFNEQNEFLSACDISIISLSDSMYGLGVPSKSYYNMAAERPLLYIGDNNSEISLIVKEYNLGWTIESGDELKLAELIDKICTETDKFDSIGKRSRQIVKEKFSKEVILKKFEEMYRND